MKTDVIALDPIIQKAVDDLRARQIEPTTDLVLVATEPHTGHEIVLRLDRELTEAEVASITEAALSEWSLLEIEREVEPHVVHVPVDQRPVVDCPDCTRGLSSRGYDLVCARIPLRTTIRGCHDGCVVACGRPR